MKKLVIFTAMMPLLALAQPPAPVHDHGPHRPLTGATRIVIKNELGHHGPRIPPKVKLLRSNPHRLTAIRFQDVDPVDAPDDEYVVDTPIRRPKIIHETNWDDDAPISDYAQTRLLLARHFALKRARERRGNSD